MPSSSHMQPRSSTRMPPPPSGYADSKPLLHVGPWQEYALSSLLARMRAQSMEEVLQAMSTVHGGAVKGMDTPVSGAVSPVDSYVGSMSSARSERSAHSSKSASSTRTSRTDPSSWTSSSAASANAALFRRARNLKYKGPTYDKPWKSKVPRRKTTKEIEVERRQNMYAVAGDTKRSELQVPGTDEPQAAEGAAAPMYGRRAPHPDVPQLPSLHSSPAAHRANAQSQPVHTIDDHQQHRKDDQYSDLHQHQQQKQREVNPTELASSTPRERDSLDDHLASAPGPRASPVTLPRTPGTPKGDDEVDDLLKWADGIDMANLSQELG